MSRSRQRSRRPPRRPRGRAGQPCRCRLARAVPRTSASARSDTRIPAPPRPRSSWPRSSGRSSRSSSDLMSERVLSGAPASPGLAIGRARVLSHPSGSPRAIPVPTASRVRRGGARARVARGGGGRARADRRGAARGGPPGRGRDRGDRGADGRGPAARVRRDGLRSRSAAGPPPRRWSRPPRSTPPRSRRCRTRCWRRAPTTCARSAGAPRASPPAAPTDGTAATARPSSSWRRTSGPRTWPSTATSSRASPCRRAA